MLNYDDVLDSNAYRLVDVDIKSQRISHAYLFVSIDENYLLAFAKKVALRILADENVSEWDRLKLKIQKDIHPDVLIFGKDAVIDVDAATDIISRTQISPFEANKKVFILLGADQMSEASQNKILKTIEDPPENTIFLFCATSCSRILPTILSRVKQVELDEISEKNIENMLILSGISEENAKIFAYSSNGNASFAEKLSHDDSFIELFNKILIGFYSLNKSHDVLDFSSYFSAKEIDKNEFFDLCLLFTRDLLFILAGKEDLIICKSAILKLKAIAAQINTKAALVIFDSCKKAKKELQIGTNPTAVVDNFLFKIVEVKVKCRRLSV